MPRKRAGCPLCGKPPTQTHTPFCSQGCRDRDLLNWLGDSYRVPGPPADEFPPDGLDSER
ncbi:DNA gyrase inhibitor YacG [Sphingomonas parva]|uniref:DNA gyrase inhibitor YacG n=1 Tax=Sphingomonas parva TaxID=2555898 RepID=A0A4Y8ZW35_9SPHN|nr:DNA gyrase inhibitor YacG [Sphingomonas parva]TFI60124.1 DNA gyrase inhibitor YacG [Sphingomonas parva]